MKQKCKMVHVTPDAALARRHSLSSKTDSRCHKKLSIGLVRKSGFLVTLLSSSLNLTPLMLQILILNFHQEFSVGFFLLNYKAFYLGNCGFDSFF